MSEPISPPFYRTITAHWPRIAAFLVVGLGLLELVVGGLTADSSLELYLMAWAATTGGVWFLFERAERAAADETKARVAEWVLSTDASDRIEGVGERMAGLFDAVFGKRHFSLRCFLGSAIASMASVLIVAAIWIGTRWPFTDYHYDVSTGQLEQTVHSIDFAALALEGGTVLALAALFNLLPDFVSLLQTRRLLSIVRVSRRWPTILTLDLALTVLISVSFMYAGARLSLIDPLSYGGTTSGANLGMPWEDSPVLSAGRDLFTLQPQVGPLKIDGPQISSRTTRLDTPPDPRARRLIAYAEEYRAGGCQDGGPYPFVRSAPSPSCESPTFGRRAPYEVDLAFAFDASVRSIVVSTRGPFLGTQLTRTSRGNLQIGFPPGIFFYSAFFTSAWLWLYAASAFASRMLLRLGSGVGLLLRATDVENQPFRSMGFVNVIGISVLFALGLPWVLVL